MLKFLRQLICRHQFTWVERRRREVCIKCGKAHRRETAAGTA